MIEPTQKWIPFCKQNKDSIRIRANVSNQPESLAHEIYIRLHDINMENQHQEMYFRDVTSNKKIELDLRSFNKNQELNLSDVTTKKKTKHSKK